MKTKNLKTLLKLVAFAGLALFAQDSLAQTTNPRTQTAGTAAGAQTMSAPRMTDQMPSGVAVTSSTGEQNTPVTFVDGTTAQLTPEATKAFASRPAVTVDATKPEIDETEMTAWIGNYNAWFEANRNVAQRAMSESERQFMNDPATLYKVLHKQTLHSAKLNAGQTK